MIVEITIKAEHNNCQESLKLTSEGIKYILKNNPKQLIDIIEQAEKRFPKGTKGKIRKSKDSGFLMTAACAVVAAT